MKSLKSLAMLGALAFAFVLTPAVSFAQTTTVKEEKVEVKELDSNTFDAELKNAKLPVLVDFTALWCGPCQQLKPKIEQLAQEFKGKVIFTKVEQTRSPGLCRQNGITAYPTVKIYAPGGKEMSTSIGNLSINDLRKWVQEQVDLHNKSLQPQSQPKP